MTTSARRPDSNLEIIFSDWLDAIRCADIDRIARRLAPEVVHQGVAAHLICPDRQAVLDNVRQQAAYVPRIDAIELVGHGDHVVLCVRGDEIGPVIDDVPSGQAAIVFTLRDGMIVHIHDYRSRAEALAAAGAASLGQWR